MEKVRGGKLGELGAQGWRLIFSGGDVLHQAAQTYEQIAGGQGGGELGCSG